MNPKRRGNGDLTPLGELMGGTGLSPDPDRPDPGPRPAPRRGYAVAGGAVLAGSDIARRVAEVWAEAVGPEIAANARPIQLNRGRLVVSTSSSAWAQSLHFMGDGIRERLCEVLRTDEIRTVFFRHAGWEATRDEPSMLRPPAGPEQGSTRNGADAGADVASHLKAAPESGEADADAADSRPPDPADLTGEQRLALDGVRDLGLSPELEERVVRAMWAAFVREGRR